MRKPLGLVVMLALALSVGFPAGAQARTCKSLYSQGYKLQISKSGSISCARARKLIRMFWIENRGRKHGGPDLAGTWYTLPGFKGWKCWEGSGGGNCAKSKTTYVTYSSSAS